MGTEEFAGWGKEDFVLWLRANYPEPPAARKGASWVFVLRFHHANPLSGKEGPVIKSTVSGAYEDCIRDLADELAGYVGEPSAKIEIHMSPLGRS